MVIRDRLSRFFDSGWYPAIYAALCVLSGVSGKAVYVPVACVLASLIILSCFFAKNKRSFIAPVLLSFYCIGVDKPDGYCLSDEYILGYYDLDGFLTVCAIGVVAAAFLFTRLIRMGVFKKENQGKPRFLWGILLLDAAFVFNGIGSAHWQPVNLVYGLIFGGVLTFFYILFRGCLSDSREDREFVCRITVAMSLIAFFQILIMCVVRLHAGTFWAIDYGAHTVYIDRGVASLGWGVATSVGGILILGVPAAMYLAARSHRGWLWLLIAVALSALTVIPRSRSSIAAAALFLVMGILVGCFWGENKKQMRITGASLVLLAIGFAAICFASSRINSSELLDHMRFEAILSDGRWDMWHTAWEDMRSAPVFGVGFEKGAYPLEDRLGNVFSNMYHGIIPQFYGAMGIVGICALAVHFFDLGKMLFRRFSWEKLLLLAVPGMILVMSVVDNFFFYANYQFVYCLFLALIEKTERQHNGKLDAAATVVGEPGL
jgi:O-antigen ligase